MTRALAPRIPGPPMLTAERAVLSKPQMLGLAATVVAAAHSWLMPAACDMDMWRSSERRRFWTALSVGSHATYALLFIIRSFCYGGIGVPDRPFYYESLFLGWLCGPSSFLPRLLGWDHGHYNQPEVLSWMAALSAPASATQAPRAACFVGNPVFMYLYQNPILIPHLMIVFGGKRAFRRDAWPPTEGEWLLKMFRWGLWLELLGMDIAYVLAYSCLPFLSVPGHWGLTTMMMLLHHVTVLPDVVCVWHESKAARASVKARVPVLA